MPRVAKTTEESKVEVPVNDVPGGQTAILEIPLSEPVAGDFPIHINCNLKGPLGTILRRIARAYDRRQACLKDGTRVVHETTAMKKILEDIAESLNTPT